MLFEVALRIMNFLAHAYLSFGDETILTGNLISDFVKGRAQYHYPPKIQKGIRLHRAIDTFTDAHPATKEAMNFFKTPYRLLHFKAMHFRALEYKKKTSFLRYELLKKLDKINLLCCLML